MLAALTANESRIIASGVLMCLVALLSIALVVVVLMQKGISGNVNAITGGNEESFFSRNKGNRKERLLRILTVAFGCALAVLAVVFFIVAPVA